MKILLLSFYHPPDLSAGSFRVAALIKALNERLPTEAELDVITTQPNRYASFSLNAPTVERIGRVTFHRVTLPPHRSGIIDQSRAFAAYLRGVWTITRRKQYDLVAATSSRLMTAALAAGLSATKRAPLYLDIRDIFVDTINDLFPGWIAGLSVGPFSIVERLTISRATVVNLVSGGFEPYFARRYPRKRFTFHTNGIDEEFLGLPAGRPSDREGRPLTVLYAGNIGEGQGLHLILPGLALRLAAKVQFRILGDGGRHDILQYELAKQNVTNVEVLPPVPRRTLLDEYARADVLFLHLNDVEAFKKVLPSKLFEYAATGKPIWAGMQGHSADFASEYISNVALFAPCDAEGALRSFKTLDLTPIARTEFIKKFDRRAIMASMADDIVGIIENEDAELAF